MSLKRVAELDLQGNVLTKLPETVAGMENLTSINLADNNFSIFPDKLTEIATLERINLEGNSITGDDYILRSFFVHGQLCAYKLIFNLFVSPPAEIPVDKLSDMPALKVLNVQSNPLDSNSRSALQSAHRFETLSSSES